MDLLINTPDTATTPLSFVFAHGAGAPMDSDFMNSVAEQLCAQGIKVIRFEFPYMAERRAIGKKRPPDRAPKLLACFEQVIAECGGLAQCVIGGKSMGGRMASLLAAEQTPRGVICLGYPFHAPGKPEKVRTEHFTDIPCPTLILQGTRDPFGKQAEVMDYDLPKVIQLAWLEDGDHDFKPRKASGRSHQQNLEQAVDEMVAFIRALPA